MLQERSRAGIPVGLFFDFSVDAYAGFAVTILAGRPFVFIDSSLPDERIRFFEDDSGLEVVLTTERLAVRAMAAFTSCEILTLEDLALGVGVCSPEQQQGDDLSCLFYTSGTTGVPLAAMHTADTLYRGMASMCNAIGLCATDTMAITGFGTSSASGAMLSSLMCGARILIHDARSHGVLELAGRLEKERATVLRMPAPLFRVFAKSVSSPLNLPDLRVFRSHADTCLPSDVEAFYRCFGVNPVFVNGLSSSEAIGICNYFTKPGERFEDERVPIGFPVDEVRIDLVQGSDNPIDSNGAGEIAITSPWIAVGYWRDEAANAERIRRCPETPGRRTLATGDLGYRLANGSLVHSGRSGRWTKIRGYRVDFAEVEASLRRVSGVREACVSTRGGNRGHDELVAYLVPEVDVELDQTAVRSELEAVLPAYMVPTVFHQISKLPLKPNGKIDRDALINLDHSDRTERSVGEPPRTAPERAMARAWKAVLDLTEVGLDEDFFELGGSSLTAMEVIEQLRRMLGVVLPVSAFFEYRTIRAMAGSLHSHSGERTFQYLVPLRFAGSLPPIYCIHGDFYDVVQRLPGEQPFSILWPMGIAGERAATSMDDVIEAYLSELRPAIRDRRYILAGYSFGGIIAWEMTRRLEQLGEPPFALLVIDSNPPRNVGDDSPSRLKQRELCLEHLERGESVPPQLRGFYFLDCLGQIARGHRAGNIATPVTYLRSWVRRDAEPDYWRSRALGGFEKHIVPGDHHSMLKEPNAESIAERIRAIAPVENR